MKNPNAVVGGAGGAGGGALVIYILGLFKVHVDVYAAGLIFTAVSSAVLWIGRDGLKGIIGSVWHGSAPKPPAVG